MSVLVKNYIKGIVPAPLAASLSALSQKKWVETLVKVAIFSLLILGIAYQLWLTENVRGIGQFLQNQSTFSVFAGLLTVCCLMMANWLTETIKWQQLLKPVEELSLQQVLKGVLLGVTVSLFTPNRIGEYGGRMWVVQKGRRLSSVVATVIGSMAQWIINIGIGGVATTALLLNYTELGVWGVWLGMITACLLLSLLILLYSNLHWLEAFIFRVPFLRRYRRYVMFVQQYSAGQLGKVAVLSLLRYSLYCLQLMTLITVFGIEIDFITGLLVVSALFFLQTLVPSIALVELGIRGNLALYLFGFFTTKAMAVLASTFVLWGINLLLPALAGYFLLAQTRFTKS